MIHLGIVSRILLGFALFGGLACNEEAPLSHSQALAPKIETRALSHKKILDKIFAPSSECSADAGSVAVQLRRLTRHELRLSVENLFNLNLDIEKDLPPDESVFGFKNNSSLNLVSIDHAVAYARVADKIALAVLDKGLMTELACSEADGQACASRLIQEWGPRIWRRPLSNAEIPALENVYAIGAEAGIKNGLQLTLRALLTAPAFLYRSEIGKDGKLDPYEWASALSYFFWSSGPDAELLAKAADGSLLNDQVLAQEVQRLLASPRAKEGLKSFVDSWTGYSQVLQVSKDMSRFPQFNSETRVQLARETEDFFDHVVRSSNGSLQDLLLADYSLGDQTLAAYYQVPWESASGRLDFSAQERRGILGHASILASLSYAHETHPIKRGTFIREHILCEELLPPPPTLMIQPPPPKEGATTRERFAAHTAQPVCKGCHIRIDGVGFGMEDFDAIGMLRTKDNNKAVDSSGELFDVDGQTRTYQGGRQLTELLGKSERVERCFALQWFRQAYGRVESEADICTIRSLGSEFHAGMSIRDLMVKVITHPSYRHRSL